MIKVGFSPICIYVAGVDVGLIARPAFMQTIKSHSMFDSVTAINTACLSI